MRAFDFAYAIQGGGGVILENLGVGCNISTKEELV